MIYFYLLDEMWSKSFPVDVHFATRENGECCLCGHSKMNGHRDYG